MAITVPDVNPQPIPGVRFQPAASETTFGGGPGVEAEGQQIQKIAADTGDIAAFEKIRANQMAVEDAQAKGSKLTTDVLYDPQTGVLGSRGKDALQAQKDGMSRLQKGMNDISTTLTGEQQQGAFNKWALSQVNVANQHMMTHVDEQLKAQDADSFKNLLDNNAAQVALGHGNPDTLAHAFGTVNDNAVAYAQRNRFDPDQTKEFVQNANDKMHTAVIDGMLKFQADDSAQKYFDANKDKMSPEAQEKVADGLQEGNLRFRAASAAQAAINGHPDSEEDALKAIKLNNPEQMDAARKLVTARFSENRAAIKNDQDDTFMRMQQMVNQKGLTDPIDRRNAVPPMAWNKLSSEQQRAIEKGGSPDETSISKWEDFTQAVKDGSLQKMSRADINSKFMPYMTPEDQKNVADAWSGKGGAQKEKTYESVLAMQDQALVGIGALSPKNPTKNQLIFKKQFNDNVSRDLDTQEAALGRQLKPEEIQSVVDNHTLKAIQTQPEGFMAGHFGNYSYEQIPDPDKQHIVELARNVGIVATKDHIEEAYKLHKQGKSDDEIAKALK